MNQTNTALNADYEELTPYQAIEQGLAEAESHIEFIKKDLEEPETQQDIARVRELFDRLNEFESIREQFIEKKSELDELNAFAAEEGLNAKPLTDEEDWLAFKNLHENCEFTDSEVPSDLSEDTETINKVVNADNRTLQNKEEQDIKKKKIQEEQILEQEIKAIEKNKDKNNAESFNSKSRFLSDHEYHSMFSDITKIISKETVDGAKRVVLFDDDTKIIESHNSITIQARNQKESATRMMVIAKAKEWKSVTFDGTPEFLQYAYLSAIKNGLTIKPANEFQKELFREIHDNNRLSEPFLNKKELSAIPEERFLSEKKDHINSVREAPEEEKPLSERSSAIAMATRKPF